MAREAMNVWFDTLWHSPGMVTQGFLQGKKLWKFKRESEVATEPQVEKSARA